LDVRRARCVAERVLRLADAAPSRRARSDEAISATVRTSFVQSDRTYGARRVWRDVSAQVSPAACIGSSVFDAISAPARTSAPPPLPPDTGSGHRRRLRPMRSPSLRSGRAQQKWVADFTYIWTAEGWLYVAASSISFTARVGWSMSASMTPNSSRCADDGAVAARQSRRAAHHSDRGSQYTSGQFQRLMAEHGATCSMKPGRQFWDKCGDGELLPSMRSSALHARRTGHRRPGQADVFDYIERFYNPRRRPFGRSAISANCVRRSGGVSLEGVHEPAAAQTVL